MKLKYTGLSVVLIILLAFSLVVFIAPFNRGAVFWLSYFFTVVAILGQLGFGYVTLHTGDSARSKFYGFPILRVGLIYLVAQLALCVVFMLFGRLVPLWIPFLIYVLLLCAAALGLIAADTVRGAVELVEERQTDNTAMMRYLRQTVESMRAAYPELDQVGNQLRFSDPVSTQSSRPYEDKLAEELQAFWNLPDEASRVRAKNQMLELIAQRNAVCKSSKSR